MNQKIYTLLKTSFHLIVYGGRFGHPAHYPPITALTSCVNGVIEACPHVNNQQEIPLASKSAHFIINTDLTLKSVEIV